MVLYFSMLMPVNLDARACLKKPFCKMCVTVCGRCCLNEGGVAGYVNRMKVKYAAKWGVQIAGMIFQARSRVEICFYTNFNSGTFCSYLLNCYIYLSFLFSYYFSMFLCFYYHTQFS